MTLRGRVKDGVVVVENAAALPEGADVTIEFSTPKGSSGDDLPALLLRHAGKGVNLPDDLAARHDHYAHGKP